MSASPDRPDEPVARRLLEAARLSPPGVGESVGPYELVAEIGRGGHSAVFRAVQASPVRRELAVKILVDPSPSVNVAARFARERAVVARLRHPGIVPLIDAGEAGQPGAAVPWFAMPLIEGEPADRWCERVGATRAVRLRVVELAGRAVAAAHALGVVHRDLKPGNILVAGTREDPQVHVIDFGVAKLLDPEFEGGGALATRVGGVVGTPEFMSPEQARLDVDRIGPETDVYALGLVGAVLLSGRIPGLPAAATRAAQPMGERLRGAADRVVPAISELAGDRSLRGEVDWIVAKACARELHDRYPNAGALADDLARLREGQPITAAPRDSGYAGLFALRKYRVQIAAIAVALAAIVGALAYMARVEANRAREEAERNARLAGLLERARIQLVPLTGKDRGDVVDESKALPILEMLYAINLELLGGQANESQQSALVLARAYDRGDRHADSERIYRGLLEEAMKNDRRPGDQAFLRFMTAGAIRRAGPARAAEARGLLDQALAYWSTLPDRPATACQALIEKSFVARLEGNHEEQGRLLADAVACTEEEAQPGHLRRREAYGFMADFHREQGALDAALQWYGRALDGLDGAMSPTAAVWRTAWQGEVLWIEREQARTAGTPLDPAKEAELQAIIESVKARDPGNNRLGRWEARRD